MEFTRRSSRMRLFHLTIFMGILLGAFFALVDFSNWGSVFITGIYCVAFGGVYYVCSDHLHRNLSPKKDLTLRQYYVDGYRYKIIGELRPHLCFNSKYIVDLNSGREIKSESGKLKTLTAEEATVLRNNSELCLEHCKPIDIIEHDLVIGKETGQTGVVVHCYSNNTFEVEFAHKVITLSRDEIVLK